AGGDYSRMRFSFQEYFERLGSDPRRWGEPLAALLGAFRIQLELGLPAIGGKDSMSGTFEHLDVPPTLVAFGITTVKAPEVISPEFKWGGDGVWLVKCPPAGDRMPDTALLKSAWDYVHAHIISGEITAAYAVGFGGVAEALVKMSLGNRFSVKAELPEEELFSLSYGSIVVEASSLPDAPFIRRIGTVLEGEDGIMHINGTRISLDRLEEAYRSRYAKVYPETAAPRHGAMMLAPALKARRFSYPGEPVDKPLVYIPVFPGTNCDYDTAKAFRKAGAEVRMVVFRNLGADDVRSSIDRMCRELSECHIFAIAGGFSAGDEPDGSGKFIASVLRNSLVAGKITELLERGGLILGICNGFQALIKSGLLPYGRPGAVKRDSPTLFRNDINRHVARMATTRVASVNSPWLSGFKPGDLHTVAFSHGEGKFVVGEEEARRLFEAGQVAFQYADPVSGEPTMESPWNPNGSYYAIEGIVSPDGQILGKMGHSERYEDNLFRNMAEDMDQPIFANAVNYFKKR
ncbi:MAG: phosphoribosylformylglycinamidine synthase subunit PurQ, partial [Bacteroidales bacterium]|nr:phosphoribosylformylglycinamidine synthase subunit PurQ [Bacteroidales bacterium]